MVYYDKGSKTGMTRVYGSDGVAVRKTTGTDDPAEATEVDAFLKRMRRNTRWAVLDAIIADELTAAQAYRADAAGTLDTHMTALMAAKARRAADAADQDLSPLVDVLLPTVRYRMQVRRLIPAGSRYPASRFTRKTIASFLRTLTQQGRDGQATTLPSSPATKSRYRAALSAFARALVEHEVIESNPVREIAAPRQTRDRTPVFLEPAQVRALIDRLPLPYQALEALMAGTGMEWGAVHRLRAKDIDLERRTIYARGTKNSYRTRYVEVSEDWAWQIVRTYVRDFLPEARIFPIREEYALREHHQAATALDLPRTTLHQHRHSYAVMHLKRRCDHQWLKRQLGHSPRSTLIYTTYGVWIDDAARTRTQMSVSESASSSEKSHEVA